MQKLFIYKPMLITLNMSALLALANRVVVSDSQSEGLVLADRVQQIIPVSPPHCFNCREGKWKLIFLILSYRFSLFDRCVDIVIQQGLQLEPWLHWNKKEWAMLLMMSWYCWPLLLIRLVERTEGRKSSNIKLCSMVGRHNDTTDHSDFSYRWWELLHWYPISDQND